MSAADLFQVASPAVAKIVVKDKNGHPCGQGSGFFVSLDGLLVTNYHVVNNAYTAAAEVEGKECPVEGFCAFNAQQDLALLKVKIDKPAVLRVSASEPPKVGTKVFAIGSPVGQTNTLSEGLVSGLRKMNDRDLIQTTAPISPGSSGGPLMTSDAVVIGVNTLGGNAAIVQNINFAVPASMVLKLIESKKPVQAFPVPAVRNMPVPPRPVEPELPKLTDAFDEAVVKGIAKAVEFLWSQQKEDGSWGPFNMPNIGQFPAGPTALACYALLESGVSIKEARMAKALRWLSREDTDKRTYSLAMRCCVWAAVLHEDPDSEYGKQLEKDCERLIRAGAEGCYTYDVDAKGRITDNSNSQYGLLGVWTSTSAPRIEVPSKYWDVVMQHWIKSQNRDGGWGYAGFHRPASYPSMTVAGLASLFVCVDNLGADRFTRCTGDTDIKAIRDGLKWLEDSMAQLGLDSTIEQGGRIMRMPLDTYYLFGVERVALASGYKYFGKVDWYRVGATAVLQRQQPNGSAWMGGWGDATVSTAYALLFLARGRHPILFNKLQHDGDWRNRPRDLAMLTRWMSKAFEKPVNWQIVHFGISSDQWHDAPVLYISGSKDPKFTDEQAESLRQFVYQGGTIFSCTECNGGAFRQAMQKLYAKIFPGSPMTPCRADHEVFKAYYTVPRTALQEVNNGARPLAFHCDYDLPLCWQARRWTAQKWTFELAANIGVYVNGLDMLRPRGTNHWPEKIPVPNGQDLKIVRLKHSGNCDPEPLAYERLARLMAAHAKANLTVTGPVEISSLGGQQAKLASLVGVGKLELGPAEQTAIREFVNKGGTLLVEAVGGNREFAESARQTLAKLFPQSPLRPISVSAPPMGLSQCPIQRVKYRSKTTVRLGNMRTPNLQTVVLKDASDGSRTAVIFSAEDISCALLALEGAALDGYAADSAYAVMRNIILWAGK